jgi:hypothetical protein
MSTETLPAEAESPIAAIYGRSEVDEAETERLPIGRPVIAVAILAAVGEIAAVANCGPGPRTAGGRSKRRAKRISRTSAGIEKTTVNAIPANMALISSHLTVR